MRTTVAALDFGTSKIVTLVAENSSINSCEVIGLGMANYEGYSLEGWNNPGAVDAMIEQSIKEAQDQCGKKIHSVYVGIPATFSKVYCAEAKVELKGTDPKVRQEDLRELYIQAEKSVDFESNIVVHTSPAWFLIDGNKRTFQPVNQPGHELSAVISFVTANHFFVEEINNRLTHLGYKVEGFYSTAAGEAMLYLPEIERDSTSVLIDVGYLCTDVLIAQGDALTYCETINELGGGHISAALAEGLKINLEEAEDKIKRKYVYGIETSAETFDIPPLSGSKGQSFTRREVNEVMLPVVDAIAEQISDAIKRSGIHLGDKSTIYLTGGGLAMNRGGLQYLSEKLGKPVREVPKKTTKLNSHTLSSALGLLDVIIDTIEQEKLQPSGGGKLLRWFRNLMGG